MASSEHRVELTKDSLIMLYADDDRGATRYACLYPFGLLYMRSDAFVPVPPVSVSPVFLSFVSFRFILYHGKHYIPEQSS